MNNSREAIFFDLTYDICYSYLVKEINYEK